MDQMVFRFLSKKKKKKERKIIRRNKQNNKKTKKNTPKLNIFSVPLMSIFKAFVNGPF